MKAPLTTSLIAVLFLSPLPGIATERNWLCISTHGCVTTTPCNEKNFTHSLEREAQSIRFTSEDKTFNLNALPPSKGALLRAYGHPVAKQGVTSLTLFEDLSFVFSTHVSIEINPETGERMGLNASVLGNCKSGVS